MLRGLAGRRILIVEDEHLIAELECATLERAGAIVGRVDNEPAALASLSQSTPDIVVLDWNLRGTCPARLAAYLKSRLIPFVIVSGYQREELPPEVRTALFAQKPFAQDELVRALARAVSR
jgi:CheY-like chemotaxis protein